MQRLPINPYTKNLLNTIVYHLKEIFQTFLNNYSDHLKGSCLKLSQITLLDFLRKLPKKTIFDNFRQLLKAFLDYLIDNYIYKILDNNEVNYDTGTTTADKYIIFNPGAINLVFDNCPYSENIS